jgi:hypothetical protein
MMKKLLVLAAALFAFGALPAAAHTVYRYDSVTGARYKARHAHKVRHYVRPYYAPRYTYSRSYGRTYWSPAVESNERAVTRQLNRQQASQPTYYYPQYSYRY